MEMDGDGLFLGHHILVLQFGVRPIHPLTNQTRANTKNMRPIPKRCGNILNQPTRLGLKLK